MAWFASSGNAPFVIALLVMIGLAIVELLALLTGFSLNDVVDEFVLSHADIDSDGPGPNALDATGTDAPGVFGRLLAWLYVGKVPVLMMLIVLLSVFGLLGLIAQGVLRAILGFAAPATIAGPAIFLASLPVVRACVAVVARILPQDESSAIDPASFIGRTARIVSGTARRGLPAEARLRDGFGTDHHVLVEPEDAHEMFPTGSVVLLLRQSGGGRFTAIANPNDNLVDQE